MYLYPKDAKFRKVRNLPRDGFKVREFSKVCANHFTADEFKTHLALAKKSGYKKFVL